MVQVIHRAREPGDYGYSLTDNEMSPLIHIHHVERNVFGNGIAIHIYGEMRIAGQEFVYAKELMLNTIQTMTLTPELITGGLLSADNLAYFAIKNIHHKGEYDNYASIDIFDDAGAEIVAGVGPDSGSVWLDFEALGE